MPVKLNQVPPPASRPSPPRVWLWLALLPLLLLVASGGALLFSSQPLQEQVDVFWGIVVGVPTFGWCLLVFGRFLLYFDQKHAANGWDQARDQDLAERKRRGRRSQQVLSVSLHTALGDPKVQLDELLGGSQRPTALPSRMAPALLCKSCLSADTPDPEQALLKVMGRVLDDLLPALTKLPNDTPLGLLLEIDSGFPEAQWRRVWGQAWSEAGIRQPVVSVDSSGLFAVDQWLDQRISDKALLLVVAIQFAQAQPQGASEVAVGILLGNRLTQTTLSPMAYLHRPEQEHGPTLEALRYAVFQALDWVPLPGRFIEHVWRVGVGKQRNAALTAVLNEVAMPMPQSQGLHDLDTLLGCTGKASPWLAIAAATQTFQRGAGPQFIFSGSSGVDSLLWGTALTPVPTLSQ
ncbi:hypothetical protein [Pseudomonas sp. Z18(2022)]|uniref:hypothetical protein n=1 Tax=Pseudomonas sp. Z18(2022) TaxID=2983410 RepID=UPI002E80F242|nr:hypothetical protein [Pseudomonas sp. Z18(2022)]